MPSEIGNLTNLQTLDLSDNAISSLPETIGQMTSLESFFLGNNQLSMLPSEIGNLTNVRTLSLSNNVLISLPPEIGHLENLSFLDVRNNQLSHLPSELSELNCSEQMNCILYIGDNPLITPPAEVVQQGTPAVLAYLRNQAAWHLRRTISGFAAIVGGLAGVGLLLHWRTRHKRKRKNDGSHSTS